MLLGWLFVCDAALIGLFETQRCGEMLPLPVEVELLRARSAMVHRARLLGMRSASLSNSLSKSDCLKPCPARG